jgi:hypothetical protein
MKFFLVRLAVWVLTLAVYPIPAALLSNSFQLEVLQCKLDALPPRSAPVVRTEKVLLYLETAEKKEIDPWLRDDIRISWITVLNASRGDLFPHVHATIAVLGLHPDRVWPAIVARRKALLGPLYAEVWGEASSPKKPVQSVTLKQFERRRNSAA